MNKTYRILLIASGVVLLDQISKYIIRKTITVGDSIELFPFFHLSYSQNAGAGFSILQDQTTILIFISIMVIGYILFSMDKIKEKQVILQVVVGFILGGATGNLIDRIIFGYVTDFLNFIIWPIFNIADSFLSVGMVCLVWYLWKHDK